MTNSADPERSTPHSPDHRSGTVTPTPQRLAIIVVVYNMRREAPRTLFSLSAAYQHGVDASDYEVLVVDNGSTEPLGPEVFEELGENFRYFFLEEAPASPAYAVNFGARAAHSDYLGLMIDGARIVSPGMLRLALMGLTAFRRPIVSALAFHLGPQVQMESVKRGYDRDEEDRLLASVAWRNDGYRLFEISVPAGSSRYGWFQPTAESNCLFLAREMYEELGGFDERFTMPGGGLVNLDFYSRVCELPDSQLLMLLGEGTFHQFHGGIMTNCSVEENLRRWKEYDEEHLRLRGRRFVPPSRRSILLGEAPAPALPWIRKSCDLFWESPHAPPHSPDS